MPFQSWILLKVLSFMSPHLNELKILHKTMIKGTKNISISSFMLG